MATLYSLWRKAKSDTTVLPASGADRVPSIANATAVAWREQAAFAAVRDGSFTFAMLVSGPSEQVEWSRAPMNPPAIGGEGPLLPLVAVLSWSNPGTTAAHPSAAAAATTTMLTVTVDITAAALRRYGGALTGELLSVVLPASFFLCVNDSVSVADGTVLSARRCTCPDGSASPDPGALLPTTPALEITASSSSPDATSRAAMATAVSVTALAATMAYPTWAFAVPILAAVPTWLPVACADAGTRGMFGTPIPLWINVWIFPVALVSDDASGQAWRTHSVAASLGWLSHPSVDEGSKSGASLVAPWATAAIVFVAVAVASVGLHGALFVVARWLSRGVRTSAMRRTNVPPGASVDNPLLDDGHEEQEEMHRHLHEPLLERERPQSTTSTAANGSDRSAPASLAARLRFPSLSMVVVIVCFRSAAFSVARGLSRSVSVSGMASVLNAAEDVGHGGADMAVLIAVLAISVLALVGGMIAALRAYLIGLDASLRKRRAYGAAAKRRGGGSAESEEQHDGDHTSSSYSPSTMVVAMGRDGPRLPTSAAGWTLAVAASFNALHRVASLSRRGSRHASQVNSSPPTASFCSTASDWVVLPFVDPPDRDDVTDDLAASWHPLAVDFSHHHHRSEEHDERAD